MSQDTATCATGGRGRRRHARSHRGAAVAAASCRRR